MQKTILIYEKDPDTLKFLKSFSRKRKNINAEFIGNISSLKKMLSDRESDNLICIVPSNKVKRLSLSGSEGSVIAIATISGDPGEGIKEAVKHGAGSYILKPYYEEDLEYKIRNAFDAEKTLKGLQDEKDMLHTLVDITRLVSSTLDPQKILYRITKKISEIMRVVRCSIIQVNDKQNIAYVVSTFENPKFRIKLDLNKYPEIQKALISKKTVIIKDINTDPVMKKVRGLIPKGIYSIMVVPIIFQKKVIGTFFLKTSSADYTFSDSEVKLCNAVANTAANSLNNAFLFKRVAEEKLRLKKLAITDYLTGLYNIRYFYHRLSEEFSRAERYNFPLSSLMLDIDYFKSINDKYGHKVGDFVLKEFAQLMKEQTRKSDILARYGGEEFIMLLPQASETDAILKAEALRVAAEQHIFRLIKGERTLTISIGVATYPGSDIKNMEDLITIADNSLYAAKESGRNRVFANHSPIVRQNIGAGEQKKR